MTLPVIDLHCDLLSYLEQVAGRSACDTCCRCSIPQLHAGGVQVQVMAVFTKTGPHSVSKGSEQVGLYSALSASYPGQFRPFAPQDTSLNTSSIATLLSFENASGFCDESELIETGLQRLREIIAKASKPLYIGLTWNSENRFGGGAHTNIGLKGDGMRLLEVMHEHEIAVDLSHASDKLAWEILEAIDISHLRVPVIASHSNARSVTPHSRNLPDDIAKEIFRRGGLVGLNFYRPFVGASEKGFVEHIAHWLALGGEDHIALGADFFYAENQPPPQLHYCSDYFEAFADASCYGRLFELIQQELPLSDAQLRKLSYGNALSLIVA